MIPTIYLQLPWSPTTGSWTTVPDVLPRSGNTANLAAMINGLMPYVFSVSGLILLLMIIYSGYQLMTSAMNPEGIEKAKSRLRTSLIGFLLIFLAFWIWQLTAVFFGLGTSFPEA